MNSPNQNTLVSLSDVATLLGCTEESALRRLSLVGGTVQQEFYSIPELAERWRCSRASVYKQLRLAGAQIVDFAGRGKRGKKLIPIAVVRQVESRRMKKI